MFDTHVHLNDAKLYNERVSHIETFKQQGGVGCVVIGINTQSSEIASEIAEDFSNNDFTVGATAGIHPFEVCSGNITESNLSTERKKICGLLSHTSIVGVGECGIDMHYEKSQETIDLQKEVFKMHILESEIRKLPLIIHSRDGFTETIDVLKEHKNISCVFHCFGYDRGKAKTILNLFSNAYFGFDCNITYPRAEQLREVIRNIPLEKILCETDAPYLSPQGKRGEINTLSNISFVYETIAALRGHSEEYIRNAIHTNVKNFYVDFSW